MTRKKMAGAHFFRAGEGVPSPAKWNESIWYHPYPKPALTRARLEEASDAASFGK